jgi:cobalt/nickel transport system ATP-binding protein
MADTTLLKAPALQAVELSFTYSDGVQALKGISLHAGEGEALALLGPNGAGKSTLLLCLSGLLHGQGDVFIRGQLLTRKNERDLRRRVAFVFQDPDDQLFMPTLEEDVAFGPLNMELDESNVKIRVEEALRRVNLWDQRHRPPHHLSFGEKRRAALATALAMHPEILLLDEPTGNLDPASRWELIEYLKDSPATRIVATHDLDLVKSLCSRCVLISGGRQMVFASTDEVLGNRDLLRQNRLAP